MKPHIGISDKNLDGVNKALTAVLADETILYIKTRKFHWNVDGESFMEFHKLFEAQYKQLEETIDEVAERISKLGGQTIGTTKEFQDNSKLKEAPGKYPTRKEMVKELLDDHETVIRCGHGRLSDQGNGRPRNYSLDTKKVFKIIFQPLKLYKHGKSIVFDSCDTSHSMANRLRRLSCRGHHTYTTGHCDHSGTTALDTWRQDIMILIRNFDR
jgi:starvation-inducible DNA-binding protein